MPWESVTTAVPLMVFVPSVAPLALEAAAAAAGAELAGLPAPAAGVPAAAVLVADELLPELEHADRARARAANPATPSIFRISILLLTVFTVLPVSHG
jgi:hypothetical protein